jgi:hypothetical protein
MEIVPLADIVTKAQQRYDFDQMLATLANLNMMIINT